MSYFNRYLLGGFVPSTPTAAYDYTGSIYTGNGGSNSITGVGFQPDWVWLKRRDTTANHRIIDSVRGANQEIFPNLTNAEANNTGLNWSFDTNGFSFNTNGTSYNAPGGTYVAWSLKAGTAPTTDNVAGAGNVPTAGSVKIDGADLTTALTGSIPATRISANTNLGFSIVKYTGNGGTNQSVATGLSSAPEMVIFKRTDAAANWYVFSLVSGAYRRFEGLNTTNASTAVSSFTAQATIITWTGTPPDFNGLNRDSVMYCFHSVTAVSSVGTYSGNGLSFGPIVDGMNFEPGFVMIKRTDNTGNWQIFDNKRNTTNPTNQALRPNTDENEATIGTGQSINMLTNGFQPTSTDNDTNAAGGTYIYLAFAQDPDATTPVLANSFNTVTYSGNATARSITGVGFKPDFVWLKERNNTQNHRLFDSVRGATNILMSNNTNTEASNAQTLTSFDSDGFSLGTNVAVNGATGTYVGWCWKALDHDRSRPEAITGVGTLDSLVSANPDAGFSIVQYRGDGTAGATVAHGLSAAPEMVIVKNMDGAFSWAVRHSVLNSADNVFLNSTNGQTTVSATAHGGVGTLTATTFGFLSGATTLNNVNASTNSYIAYCWSSITGYSDFGSYTGTNSAGNAVTGLGFEPRFLLIKGSTGTGRNWVIKDSTRSPSDPRLNNLYPNLDNNENTLASLSVDFDSDGFTLNGTSGDINAAETYIYMAFA